MHASLSSLVADGVRALTRASSDTSGRRNGEAVLPASVASVIVLLPYNQDKSYGKIQWSRRHQVVL